MTERISHLVVPLAPQVTATATDMRTTDTAQLQLELGASGAVSPLLGADAHRRGDEESTNGASTATGTTTPGSSTSTMATRTRTTRTTSCPSCSSADLSAARHADLSFATFVRAYLDCRRQKRTSSSARAFEIVQESRLYEIYRAVMGGTYTPGPSVCFVSLRPKPREVWAAAFADRVVHHFLYNHIAPSIERTFIADSCACLVGRGTLYAAERLAAKIRSITQGGRRRAFYLKCDLANFFVSIDKPLLGRQLDSRIPDPFWRDLARVILEHDPRVDVELKATSHELALIPFHKSLFNQPAHLGLPIGNLPSQFFANVYLDPLDQFVKHRLRARHYVRYVDDFVLLHESPRQLNAWLAEISAFVDRGLRVRLNTSKTILQPLERGVDFVGQLIHPWRTITRRRTVRAAVHRLLTMPADKVYQAANSYLGLVRQPSHSHHDQCLIANAALDRKHAVNHRLTKVYHRANQT